MHAFKFYDKSQDLIGKLATRPWDLNEIPGTGLLLCNQDAEHRHISQGLTVSTALAGSTIVAAP